MVTSRDYTQTQELPALHGMEHPTLEEKAWQASEPHASVVSPLSGSVSVTSAAIPDARIAPSAACSRSSSCSATRTSLTSGRHL